VELSLTELYHITYLVGKDDEYKEKEWVEALVSTLAKVPTLHSVKIECAESPELLRAMILSQCPHIDSLIVSTSSSE